MKKISFLFAGAMIFLFCGVNFMNAQSLNTGSSDPSVESRTTTRQGNNENLATGSTSSHEISLPGLDAAKAQFLQEIATEQSILIVSITPNIVRGNYRVVTNQPGIARTKIENFTNACLDAKINPR